MAVKKTRATVQARTNETTRAPLMRLPDTARSIGGNVVAILRAAIINGDLHPGKRLGQDELCAEFGVSQAPVREALRKLEAEGLVEHRPNRGVFVLGIERDELLEVVAPTRVLLECYAIGRSLSSRPDDLLDGLSTILDAMKRAAKQDDLPLLNDLDVEFHELAISLSDQSHTMQLWRSIMPRLRAEFTRLAPAHARTDEIVDEHRRLLEAIRSKKTTTIRAAVHEHAVTATRELLDHVTATTLPVRRPRA